jgi:hypothetical protein
LQQGRKHAAIFLRACIQGAIRPLLPPPQFVGLMRFIGRLD